MKRILTFFLSLILLISCLPLSALAVTDAERLNLTLTVDGENIISVQPGDEIEVSLFMNNVAGEAFNVSNHQTQIRFDMDFFEYTDQPSSYELVKANSCSLDTKSLGTKVVEILGMHISGARPATFESSQLVAKMKFKVKEGLSAGDSGIMSFFYMGVANGFTSPATTYETTGNNLTVFINQPPAEMHTITYKDGDTTISTGSYAENSIISISDGVSGVTNKRFVGWEDESGTIWNVGDNYTVTTDMTFTAKWVNKYTLHFETNGGSAVADKVEWEDTDIVIARYTTEKTGFVFEGWYEDEALTTQVASNFKLTSDKTIYAKWTEAPKPTYTLTFNTNGGSAITPLTQIEGTVIDLSSYRPTKSSYTFSGWYKDSALTQPVSSITLNSNTTVYAKWTLTQSGGITGGGTGESNYTLTLKNPDGTIISRIEKSADAEIDLDKLEYSKEGYVLEGWYKDKAFTDKVTTVKLNKSITLYAKWVKKDVTPSKPDYKPGILTDDHYAYIIGRDGGVIAPESDITRAEVATIIYRLLDEDVRNKAKTTENTFTDVNQDDWFNTAVSTLASLELVKGRTADCFAPDAFITRAELATIFARMVEVEYDGKVLFSDISGHWAESYINEAGTAEWIVGYNGLFRPDDNITRAEVMTLVNRVLNREPESKDDLLDGMTTWKDNADESAWYYLAIQEATNSHSYEMKADGVHEKWTALKENPDWTE